MGSTFVLPCALSREKVRNPACKVGSWLLDVGELSSQYPFVGPRCGVPPLKGATRKVSDFLDKPLIECVRPEVAQVQPVPRNSAGAGAGVWFHREAVFVH